MEQTEYADDKNKELLCIINCHKVSLKKNISHPRPEQWASWFFILVIYECHLSFLTNQLFPKLTAIGKKVGWYWTDDEKIIVKETMNIRGRGLPDGLEL